MVIDSSIDVHYTGILKLDVFGHGLCKDMFFR